MSCRFVSWASLMASRTISSDTSLAPASIISTPSRDPATTRSRVLSSDCWYVGLMTNSPSTQPIRVTPIGPLNGMSEIDRAVEAPTMDMMSRGVSRSAERGVVMICTSLRKSFGNSGLSGRSVRRMVRTVSVVGRPSRRGNPPGMRPRAYRRSSKVDGQREEVDSFPRLGHRCRDQHHGIALSDDDRAVRLLSELSGLYGE